MLKINRAFIPAQLNKAQSNHKQSFAGLEPLKQDTVTFSGWFFSKKSPVNEHVTPEAYKLLTDYIETNSDNPDARKAVQFIKTIKRFCEEGDQIHLCESSAFHSKFVEKHRIEEVGDILTTLASSILPSSNEDIILKINFEKYKSLLDKRLD